MNKFDIHKINWFWILLLVGTVAGLITVVLTQNGLLLFFILVGFATLGAIIQYFVGGGYASRKEKPAKLSHEEKQELLHPHRKSYKNKKGKRKKR